ncbi:chloride channel protein [Corynebacterium sp.]|uniref:chloride channel protein n=1 Tax=Corynebacterium sp. TaxID=1720 RepID=UPI0026E02647|nr:chloride channel protein [Corynebacterium sp.]MDO5512111.1 chloride channel protein [Corynebacterium sp.]
MFRSLAALAALALVVFTGGVAAGLIGGAMAWLVHRIHALVGDGPLHPVAAAAIGGVLAGLGWWWLRRSGPVRSVEESATTDTPLPLGRTTCDALLQLLAVGSGISLGREQAPRQASAAVLDRVSRLVRLDEEHRRLVVAAAAGAGLAAVYNVPLAGILFTLEALPVRRSARSVLITVTMSGLATVTAWPLVGNHSVYWVPDSPFDTLVLWMLPPLLLASVIVGRYFLALIRSAHTWKVIDPRWLPLSVGAATAGVVTVSQFLPGVTGNGEDIVRAALDPVTLLPLLLTLLLVKPLLTAASLGSGALGGTLTPALAVGAALGAVAGVLVDAAPATIPVLAVLGAAMVLAIIQKAPLFAAAIAWELTWAPLWVIPLLVVGTLGASWLAHRVGRATS